MIKYTNEELIDYIEYKDYNGSFPKNSKCRILGTIPNSVRNGIVRTKISYEIKIQTSAVIHEIKCNIFVVEHDVFEPWLTQHRRNKAIDKVV